MCWDRSRSVSGRSDMYRHGRHHWGTGAYRPSSNGPFRHIVLWGLCRTVFYRSHIVHFPGGGSRDTPKASWKHTGLQSNRCHRGMRAPFRTCIGCSDQDCIRRGKTAFSWKRIFRLRGEWEGDRWHPWAKSCIYRPRGSIQVDIAFLCAGTNRRLHPRLNLSGST